jgi:hypothetical protein
MMDELSDTPFRNKRNATMQDSAKANTAFVCAAYKLFNSGSMRLQLLNFFAEIGSKYATHATVQNNQGQ